MPEDFGIERLQKHIISPSELKDAIAYRFGLKRENSPEIERDAEKMAQYFLNFFGYSDRIIDNILLASDRNNFYMLEDEGILNTEREETNLLSGHTWRIHYWTLEKKNILEFVKAYRGKKNRADDDHTEIYQSENMDEMWRQRKGEVSNGAEG